MDLCSLIDRNAAFAPDKTAIAFEGERLSYARVRRAHRTDRHGVEAGARRRPRRPRRDPEPEPAGLSGPALRMRATWCDAGAAELAAGGRRAAASFSPMRAQRSWCSSRHLPDVLPELAPGTAVIGLDFAPSRGATFEDLLARSEGSGRNPHTDLSCPLLIVYTSGTTGRPKGAVLRQEALVLERRHEPAHAQHDVRRSRADGAAVLPCRRPQHPDHAGAAAWRDRHDPRPLHAGYGARGHRTGKTDPDRDGAGNHPGRERASRLDNGRSLVAEGRRRPARPSCRRT